MNAVVAIILEYNPQGEREGGQQEAPYTLPLPGRGRRRVDGIGLHRSLVSFFVICAKLFDRKPGATLERHYSSSIVQCSGWLPRFLINIIIQNWQVGCRSELGTNQAREFSAPDGRCEPTRLVNRGRGGERERAKWETGIMQIGMASRKPRLVLELDGNAAPVPITVSTAAFLGTACWRHSPAPFSFAAASDTSRRLALLRCHETHAPSIGGLPS